MFYIYIFRRRGYANLSTRIINSELSLHALHSAGYRFNHRHPLMSLGHRLQNYHNEERINAARRNDASRNAESPESPRDPRAMPEQ